jgi:hypothetical protein
MMARPVTATPTSPGPGFRGTLPLRSVFLLSVTGALLLLPGMTLAQPDALVAKLLFEPVPLVEEGAPPAIPLISFSAAEADIPEPAAEKAGLTREEREAMEADIAAYIARIGDSEAEVGPYSDQLREDLFNTGLLYQQLEDHTNALLLMERTLAVSRINYGLESLDQVPVMEAMAQSYKALDKLKDADAMMDAAFLLQQKVHGEGSPELVQAQLKLGDWNTAAFMERSSILVNIPRMNVQNFLNDPRNYIQPVNDLRDTPLFKLYQARGNYLSALKSLVDARNFTHPDLLALERELLTNYFLHMHQENILYEPDFYLTRRKTKTASRLNQNAIELMTSENYDLGREAHKRSIAYIFNDPNASPAQLATAMLEEADWDLLFERKTVAADKYEVLYHYFIENPDLREEVLDILYPAVPVVLPTYLPPPNSREKLGIAPDAEVSFFGYIDVSFELNKFGKTRRVKVLGKGGEITRNMEIRLSQYLRKVLFRPRYSGEEVDTTAVRLRYYIGI